MSAADAGSAKRKRGASGSDASSATTATAPAALTEEHKILRARELWYSEHRMSAILNSYTTEIMGKKARGPKSIARRTAELAAVFGAGRFCRALFGYDLDCMPGTDSHGTIRASDLYVSPPADGQAGTGFVIRTDSYYEADGDAPRLSIQLIPEAVYNTHAAAAKQPLTTDAWKPPPFGATPPNEQKRAKKPNNTKSKKASDADERKGGEDGDDGVGADYLAAYREEDTNSGVGRSINIYRNPPIDKSSIFATEWERDDQDYGPDETDTTYDVANYNGAWKRVAVPITETVLIAAFGRSAEKSRNPQWGSDAGSDAGSGDDDGGSGSDADGDGAGGEPSALALMRSRALTIDLDAVRVARSKFFGLRETDLNHLVIRDSTWISALTSPLVVSAATAPGEPDSSDSAAYEAAWTKSVLALMADEYGAPRVALSALVACDAARALIAELAKWNYATADAAFVASGRTVFNLPLSLIVLIAEYAEPLGGVIDISEDEE